jgi:hypothetical protein
VPLIDHHYFNHGITYFIPSNKRQEADTIRRTRFFHVINNRAGNVIIKDVCERENASEFWWGAATPIRY